MPEEMIFNADRMKYCNPVLLFSWNEGVNLNGHCQIDIYPIAFILGYLRPPADQIRQQAAQYAGRRLLYPAACVNCCH
jgi:hypothetical protein